MTKATSATTTAILGLNGHVAATQDREVLVALKARRQTTTFSLTTVAIYRRPSPSHIALRHLTSRLEAMRRLEAT